MTGTPELTPDQLAYLRSLIRMDIRKHRKSIIRFTPKPGQDPGEAAAVLTGFRDGQEFREHAYEALGGVLERMAASGSQEAVSKDVAAREVPPAAGGE